MACWPASGGEDREHGWRLGNTKTSASCPKGEDGQRVGEPHCWRDETEQFGLLLWLESGSSHLVSCIRSSVVCVGSYLQTASPRRCVVWLEHTVWRTLCTLQYITSNTQTSTLSEWRPCFGYHTIHVCASSCQKAFKFWFIFGCRCVIVSAILRWTCLLYILKCGSLRWLSDSLTCSVALLEMSWELFMCHVYLKSYWLDLEMQDFIIFCTLAAAACRDRLEFHTCWTFSTDYLESTLAEKMLLPNFYQDSQCHLPCVFDVHHRCTCRLKENHSEYNKRFSKQQERKPNVQGWFPLR